MLEELGDAGDLYQRQYGRVYKAWELFVAMSELIERTVFLREQDTECVTVLSQRSS